MLKVGITGGIGSGKSLICKVFEIIGIPVFYADIEAKLLLNNDEIKQTLFQWFGNEIFSDDNNIDKIKFANLIFNNPEALNKVNNLIHPKVGHKFDEWCTINNNNKYVVQEAALIFESGIYLKLDATILVSASENTRIKRVMERDNASHEAVLNRIANQMDDAQKRPLATFEIYNNGNEMLVPQILKIDNLLKSGKVH